MHTIRDTRFATRYLARNIAIFTPIAIALLILRLTWGRHDVPLWLAIVSFVTAIAWWAWQDRQLLRSYHCPRCGLHLPRPAAVQRSEGDPLLFCCTSCEVVWDTTLGK